MVGGDRLRRPARRREVAAVLRDPELVAEDRAGRRSAEADEYLRLEQGELAERRARWNEGRGGLAMWLRPGGVPRDERAETPHTGIADVLQQIAILVREPPQHVVEDLPARWIGRRSGLTRQLQKFPWHLHGTGQ